MKDPRTQKFVWKWESTWVDGAMDSPFYWGYWEGPKCTVPEVLSNFVWYSQGWARLTSGALPPKSWQLPPVLRKSFGLFLLESLRILPSSRMRGRGLMANIPYLEGSSLGLCSLESIGIQLRMTQKIMLEVFTRT